MNGKRKSFGLLGEDESIPSSSVMSFRNYYDANGVLEACYGCGITSVKYKCPACNVRSCSLRCVNRHKSELNCSGIRDRLAFKKLSDFDQKQFIDDYFFLEEGTQLVDGVVRQRKNILKTLDELPPWIKKLCYEARMRGTQLRILPAGFLKRRKNTTTYMYGEKLIHWDIEWCFYPIPGPKVDQPVFLMSHRVPESKTLREALEHFLNLLEDKEKKCFLEKYDVDLTNITLLLKTDSEMYLSANIDKSIRENLAGRRIIEFPTFVVVNPDKVTTFNVVTDEVYRQEQGKARDEISKRLRGQAEESFQ